MRRRWTCALGALALSLLAGPALGVDPGDKGATVPAQAPLAPQGAPQVLAPGAAADTGSSWGHVLGGAGVYLLKPFIEKDRAWVKMLSVPGDAGDFQNVTVTDFTYDLQAAPRVWLGWVSDAGWGARARYFHFEADGHAPPGTLGAADNFNGAPFDSHGFALDPASPVGQTALFEPTANLLNNNLGTDILTVSSHVQLDVWDLEAVDQLTCGCWQWTFAVGVRHADLAEFYDATRRNSLDTDGSDVRSLRSSHRFTGTGPTVAVDGARLLGDTGLAVYGTARGAALFGTRRQIAIATNTGPVFHVNGDNSTETFSTDLGTTQLERDDFVPVAEAEFGVEWSKEVGSLHPFFQVGVVGQGWFNALSNNNPGSGVPPTPVNANGLLGLLGINIAGGVSY